MRRYECVVIIDPDVPDDEIRKLTDKYTELIKSRGGDVIKIEDWGPKRLAYLVGKRDKGRYFLFDFVGLPDVITELERQLKISDEIMKYLSVKLDDEIDLEAFKAAQQAKEETSAPEPVPASEVATEETVPTEAAALNEMTSPNVSEGEQIAAPETAVVPESAVEDQTTPVVKPEGGSNE